MSPTQGNTGAAGDDRPANKREAEAPTKKRRRQRGIQIDGYGIKTDLRPAEINERHPKSWRHVRKAVNAALMGITVNAFRLANDLLLGSRKFIRGVAEIPAAAARRIYRAHDLADREESIRQEKFGAKELPAPDAAKVLEQLEALFAEWRGEGLVVEPHDLEDGRTGILIVPEGVRDDAVRMAQAALPRPSVDGLYGLSIQTILPPRVAKMLGAAGLITAGDLASRTAAELLSLDGFGEKSLAKVRATLERLGMSLEDDAPAVADTLILAVTAIDAPGAVDAPSASVIGSASPTAEPA